MRKFIVFTVLVISLGSQVWAQCAMCKGQLEGSSNSNVGLAVNDGILYLLSLPFIMGIAMAVVVWKHSKKEKSQLED